MATVALRGTPARYPAADVGAAGEPQTEAERIEALYKRSRELYSAGELEVARRGFVEVRDSGLATAPQGQRPEDYIATIDRLLAAEGSLAAPQPPATQPQMLSAAAPAMSPPGQEEDARHRSRAIHRLAHHAPTWRTVAHRRRPHRRRLDPAGVEERQPQA